MRKLFIPRETNYPEQETAAATIEDAERAAPWAAEIIECERGFMAFESVNDAEIWRNQK